MEYIITFKNTNWAIKSEQYLLEAKLQVAAMPLPSQISAGCGICLRVSAEDIGGALRILAAKQVEDLGIFSRVGQGREYSYSEITDR